MSDQKVPARKPKITYLEYQALLGHPLWGKVLAAEHNISKDMMGKVEKTKEEWDAMLEKLKNRPAGKVGPATYKPRFTGRVRWGFRR